MFLNQVGLVFFLHDRLITFGSGPDLVFLGSDPDPQPWISATNVISRSMDLTPFFQIFNSTSTKTSSLKYLGPRVGRFYTFTFLSVHCLVFILCQTAKHFERSKVENIIRNR